MRVLVTPAARLALGVALIIWIVIALLPPSRPAPLPATAPPQEFSAGRAMAHIEAIAQRPHPIESPEKARVRDYILAELAALGMQTELQAATEVQRRAGKPVTAYVENIMSRVPGTANTRPVLMMAHYDSVRRGPGAADDASGVAVLLESARVLRNTPPLRNDVIFLFTDGEESGLHGSHLFARDHRWAREPGIILNLEGGPNGGPPAMFETSAGNEWLVRALRAAVPGGRGWSFSTEMLPSVDMWTDLYPLKRLGLAGMTFGFGDNINARHGPLDNVARLDRTSIQEQGSYALPLLRRFGNEDLSRSHPGDAVYFPTPMGLIVYSSAWVRPLGWIGSAAFILVTWFGRRRCASASWISIPLGLVAILQLIVALRSPGASYLLTWPLLAGVISFGVLVTAPVRFGFGWRIAVISLCPAVVFLILLPLMPLSLTLIPTRRLQVLASVLAGIFSAVLITILPQLVLLLRRAPGPARQPVAAGR
jgi:hypothetical protein